MEIDQEDTEATVQGTDEDIASRYGQRTIANRYGQRTIASHR